jgi:hypothetical protein
MGGGTPVKDTPLGVAKRILDRGASAHTIKVQSEGEKALPIAYQSPLPHCACLPSALFVGYSPVHFWIRHQRRCDLDGGFLPAQTCWQTRVRAQSPEMRFQDNVSN